MRQLGGRDGDSGEKNETAPLLVSSECFLPVGSGGEKKKEKTRDERIDRDGGNRLLCNGAPVR
jgi:hypothetical protein